MNNITAFKFEFYPLERIVKLRKKLKKTQKKFGELFGASVHVVRKWEKGERTPQPSVMILMGIYEAVFDNKQIEHGEIIKNLLKQQHGNTLANKGRRQALLQIEA